MPTSKIIPAIALVMSLTACGGGSDKKTDTSATASSNSSTAYSSPSSNIASSSSNFSSSSSINTIGTAGIFDIDYNGFTGVYTFLDNGDFYGLHFVDNGSTLAGHPYGNLSSTNSAASREHIAWANFIDASNGFGFMEENGMFGRTFTATSVNVSITGLAAAENVVFAASSNTQKRYSSTDAKSLFNDPIPMASIEGVYTGIVRTVGIAKPITDVTFTIASNGTFTTTAVDCTFTGALVQHGATGVFDVQVTTSGSSCSLSSLLKGVVVPLAFSDNKPTLSVQLDDLNRSQSAVFIIRK